MTYRLPNHPPERRRHLFDVATPVDVYVDNGTIARLKVPCSYVGVTHHDHKLHDHIGWPSPDHPDDSCQIVEAGNKIVMVNEMNLPDEGYTDIRFAFVDKPDGLTADGEIDVDTVWLTFSPHCESAITEDVEVIFAAYATGLGMDYDGNMTVPLSDIIAKGTLHIVAGPLPDIS